MRKKENDLEGYIVNEFKKWKDINSWLNKGVLIEIEENNTKNSMEVRDEGICKECSSKEILQESQK